MKRILLILILIFIVGCSSNEQIKKEDINSRFFKSSDKDYQKWYGTDLEKMHYIIQNGDEMKNIGSSYMYNKILDFKDNETNTVISYTTQSKLGVQKSIKEYGIDCYLKKYEKGEVSNYIGNIKQIKKTKLEDYLIEEMWEQQNEEDRYWNLEKSILNMLADERTVELTKYEMEKLFFVNGLRCYIYEKKFDDNTTIRIYCVNENYNINYIKSEDLNFIQTFNEDGLLSSQSITTEIPIKIIDMFLINSDGNKPNRLILFTSNLNDIDGQENTTIRTELYFLEFIKVELEDITYFKWDNKPIKVRETIYDAGFFTDFSEEGKFDIEYFFDGISIGIHKGIFFDMLQEIEKDKSFFITSSRMINEISEYFLPEIDGYRLPVFIKYDVLE